MTLTFTRDLVNKLPESSDKDDLVDLLFLAFNLFDENKGEVSIRQRIDQLFTDDSHTDLCNEVSYETISQIRKDIQGLELPLNTPEIKKELGFLEKAVGGLEVEIPDENLKKYIMESLKKGDEKVTGNDLVNITKVNSKNNAEIDNVKNFSGLEKAVNLQEIHVEKPNKRLLMNDWSLLKDLSTLEIPNSELENKDLDKIASLPTKQLLKCNLENNHLTNVSSLKNKIVNLKSSEVNLKNQKILEESKKIEKTGSNNYYVSVQIPNYYGFDGEHVGVTFPQNVDFNPMTWDATWYLGNDLDNLPKQISYSWSNQDGNFTGTVTIPLDNSEIIDKSELSLKNNSITTYVGDSLNEEDLLNNIDVLKNREGNNSLTEDLNKVTTNIYDENDKEVDLNKALLITGKYKVVYQYNQCKTTLNLDVKPNKSSLHIKDITIFVGEKWNAEDNFVSATDKDGNQVDFSNISVKGDNEVNTNVVGKYEVVYSTNNLSEIATVEVIKQKSSEPDWYGVIPANIIFQDKTKDEDASVKLVNATDKKTPYSGASDIEVKVVSKNGYNLLDPKLVGSGISYRLVKADGNSFQGNEYEQKLGTLSKTMNKLKLKARIIGKVTETGNYTDTLNYHFSESSLNKND